MEIKTCTKCGEIKPLDEFKKDKRKANGRGSHCKACSNQYNASRPISAETKERYRALYKARYDRRKYQATVNRGLKAWHERHPGAASAHKRVNYAVKVGKLPHVSALACSSCGAQAAAYHHYLGYERIHHFDVIPLCRPCHIAADA